MELREKIVEAIERALEDPSSTPHDAAGYVLAIPEIRDALNGVRPVGGYWERTGTGKGARKWVPVP